MEMSCEEVEYTETAWSVVIIHSTAPPILHEREHIPFQKAGLARRPATHHKLISQDMLKCCLPAFFILDYFAKIW